jgi:hypothetical protein
MEGTRGRSYVIFILILILMLNIFSVLVMAPEGELEIVVDSTSKGVSPGEDAVFYWTAYNNDTFNTYDLSVSSEEPSEFSETSFTLEPGEFRTITQTIKTSPNDANNTHYSRHVKWEGVWHRGVSSGTITPMEALITVTVITDEEDKPNGDGDGNNGDGENGGGDGGSNGDDENGDDSTPAFESIFLIAAILVAVILMRKKRKKASV